MSAELDELLKNMNDAMKGRLEGNIPLGDPYWNVRDAYQKAFHNADKIHVPVVENVEEHKAEEFAIQTPVEPVETKKNEKVRTVEEQLNSLQENNLDESRPIG